MKNICSKFFPEEVSECPENLLSWLELNSRHVDFDTASRLLQLHDDLTGYFGSVYPYYLHIFRSMDNLIKSIKLGYSDECILTNIFYHNGLRIDLGKYSPCGQYIDLVKLLNQNYIIRL